MTSTTDSITTPTDLNDFGSDVDLGWVDPFDDDTPLTCGIENPEECEACQ